jgi:hypothetical protein
MGKSLCGPAGMMYLCRRMRLPAVLGFLFVSALLAAHPLVGTWVSREPILVNLRFSLTFRPSEYQVDCSLGQTLGLWYATVTQIHFTPTKVGINSGDVGSANIWDYRFVGPDTFQLSAGPISVRLFRKENADSALPLSETGPARVPSNR